MTTTASDPGGRTFLPWSFAHPRPHRTQVPTSSVAWLSSPAPCACSPSLTMTEFEPAPCFLWLESSSGFLMTS